MRATILQPDAVAAADALTWDASTDAAMHTGTSASSPPARGSPSRPACAGRWLATAAAGECYAVPLPQVQEVVAPDRIVRLRGAAQDILGAMNLRGRVLPVIDLALWLGAPYQTTTDDTRIVVLKRGDELIGLRVERVLGVQPLTPGDVAPPPSDCRADVLGFTAGPTTRVLLLDPSPFFG